MSARPAKPNRNENCPSADKFDIRRTGLVVRGRDADGLAQAMLELCTDPSRVKRMGEEARLYAEERSFGSAFLATWELYKNVTTAA